MSESIAVLGATGVYGRHLVPRLVAAGYRVRALVRRPEAAARPRLAEPSSPRPTSSMRRPCEPGSPAATSRSTSPLRFRVRAERATSRRTTSSAARARRSGSARAAPRASPRIVQQSIAMVHAGGGDAWADETTVSLP